MRCIRDQRRRAVILECHASPRILVVESAPEHAELAAQALAGCGFDSQAVYTGREAIDHVRQDLVDAIVTELLLRDMDGLALLRACRRVTVHGPGHDARAVGPFRTV